MCGGTVRIFIEELSEEAARTLDAVLAAREAGQSVAVATILDGPTAGARLAVVGGERCGGLGRGDLMDHNVERELRGALQIGRGALRRYGADGATLGDDVRVHIASFAAAPRLIVIGAVDYSAALAQLARGLGYRVTIVDAREPFVRSPRFSSVAEIAVDWPDRFLEGQQLTVRDAIVVCTHDPKFDEPALVAGLASGAGYVGALGSRRTHAERRERLRRRGIGEGDLERIAAPCGLDIGARTPAETAVSILAEMIAASTGRAGEPLSLTEGPIHSEQDVDQPLPR
jgi:xanthine dehydrogenase accessory factor